MHRRMQTNYAELVQEKERALYPPIEDFDTLCEFDSKVAQALFRQPVFSFALPTKRAIFYTLTKFRAICDQGMLVLNTI